MTVKQFQYEIQQYQEDCITNIVSLFDELRQGKSFIDVFSDHHKTNRYNFPVQDTKNIDIIMETGTGKTFTFIKTIFELNKNFGYKKFIVLIPTVPIREGTKANLADTKDYFKSFYANEKEKEIETFVYESGNISSITQFLNSSHLSVLVMTPSSFNSKDNILNRPLERDFSFFGIQQDQTPPKSYLECLKRLNPIVIMDEPHRFEGDWETEDENKMKEQFEIYNKLTDNFALAIETIPLQKNEDIMTYIERLMKIIQNKKE